MIALLIHVHTHPDQVARLVSRLRHPEVDIYINVDGKVNADEFRDKIKDVHFIEKRVEVRWGRFSQVQQMLNSFEEIMNVEKNYSHVLFISGLDYPVQPIQKIRNFLKHNTDKSFIDYHKLGDDAWSKLMKKRYEYWYFLPHGDIRNNEYVKRLLLKLGYKRKYPFREAYYGSCWFCLNEQAVRYIIDFTHENPDIVRFFQYSGCSDELYIQSLLMASPLKDSFVNKIYRFFDWGDQGKSPKILTIEDYDRIKESDAWFARKLDIHIDSEIFDKLDELNFSPYSKE